MQALSYIHSFPEYVEQFRSLLLDYSPRIISAFIILFIGLYAIRVLNRIAKRIMQKREIDPTLSKFLADSLLWVLRFLLFITFISKLGIETSSFVAILGAAGLAVGLSLQGSLSNFAGGMLIILFKPFRVGDYIEAQNVSGKVSEIQIFVTKLITLNNQTVFVPNGILSNGTITNHSMNGIRRAEISISIQPSTNLSLVKNSIMEVLDQNKLVLKEPKPILVVSSITDTAILLSIKPWAKNEDFVMMCSDVLEQSIERLREL
jgi:small conductance mechanosensitive channel